MTIKDSISCNNYNRKLLCTDNFLFLFATLFIFIGFFYGLSHYLILDMNEGLYAEVAREMLEMKNYIIPSINHVPYIEKPPLFYWLLVLSYKLFGVSTFAARLIPAISSAAVALLLILFGKTNKHLRAGCYAAIVFASSIFLAVMGRVVFVDMLLTATITATLLLFFCWYNTDKVYYLWGAYTCLALAFLTKGLIAICISGIVALGFLLLRRTPLKKVLNFFNPLGIGIFLAIVVPWLVAASARQPDFMWSYFVNEQFYRFLNIRIPHDYHTGNWYYYLPNILAYLLPWTFFVPILFKRLRGRLVEQNPMKLFLWLWFLLALLFFSLAGDKGDYYMIVGIPPLAILLGLSLENLINDNKHLPLAALFYLLSAIGVAVMAYFLSIDSGNILGVSSSKSSNLLILTLSYFVIYGLLGCWLTYYFRQAIINFFLVAGFVFPLINFYVEIHHLTDNKFSQITLLHYIKSHDSTRKVYLFRDYEEISSVLFFLQRPLPIINSASQDLYYGSRTQKAKTWFITNQQFIQEIIKQPVYVILLKERLQEFTDLVKAFNFCSVTQSPRALIVSNVCPDQER